MDNIERAAARAIATNESALNGSEVNFDSQLIPQKEPATLRETELLLANQFLIAKQTENERQLAAMAESNRLLKKSERDLRQLNTLLAHKVIKRTTQYAFISQINQAIVHYKDELVLFQQTCRIAHEVGKFKIAWIGTFDTGNNKINIAAQSSIAEEDLHLFTAATYLQNSPQDQVLQTGNYHLCNNVLEHPDIEKWRAFTSKNSILSIMILPIKRLGVTVATLNLYSSEYDFFDGEEIQLLREVSGDLSFALDVFEKEKRHKETENLVTEREKRFRALIENGADAVAILSAEGKVNYISPSIQGILGYTEAEAMELDIFSLIHPDDLPAMAAVWEAVLQTKGVPVKGHTGRILHKEGHWRWLEAMITNMLHDPTINGIIDNFRDVTHTVKLEKQREFDKTNLDALINTTDDLMWSIDKNFKLVTFNRPFFNAIKRFYAREVKEGDSIFFPELTLDEHARFKAYYKRVLAGNAFTEIEYTQFPQQSWGQISYYPVKSGNEVIGSACYSRDITNLKIAENSLQKSEIFNRGILNSLASHIAVVDQGGKIVAVNEAWELFGIKNSVNDVQKTGVGANYFEECQRAARSGVKIGGQVLEGMKEVMSGKRQSLYLEYACHSPTKKRWFGMGVKKFEGDEPLIVVSHHDITERKFAEERLLESQTQLTQAQALAHMGSWEMDFKTNMLKLSDESCRIFGICNDNNQLSIAAWSKLIHRKDRPFVLNTIKNSRNTLQDMSYHYRITPVVGPVKHVYSESKFVFDANNKPTGLYGIMQDITERKKAEQEREKITTDILNRNKDLEQFSYIVSHNLRAPVANIIGLSELIEDGGLQPEIKQEVLQGISHSVKKLDEVITDLNYILQQKQQLSQEKETVHFSKLANDVIGSIATLTEKQQAEIVCDFSEVGKMRTVKSYLHSIFYNLISNSLKYRNPNNSPLISISSRRLEDKILLIFKDNGMGIDLKNKGAEVFGIYKRFHPFVSEGKGIGLYMVKTQVESLGAKIDIESEINQGTTFTIAFPIP